MYRTILPVYFNKLFMYMRQFMQLYFTEYDYWQNNK